MPSAQLGSVRLQSGRELAEVEVAYETYGTLAPARDNAVVVCHALTGDARAAGPGGWWEEVVGPGRAIDTDRWFVVSSNLLGGCRGTTGPSSVSPATGEPYGLDFPPVTVSDLVAVQRRLCRELGLERLHAVVGGSLGGMQALQWQLDAPGEVERAGIVCASSLLTDQNIAFSTVAREAVRRAGPEAGLRVARMMAHITYLSEESMRRKFGRARHDGRTDPPIEDSAAWLGTAYEVESYLDHQGQVFVDRFDPLTYLWLTRVMDFFDPFADRDAVRRALAEQPGARQLVLSFSTDWRFPTSHSERIESELLAAGAEGVERVEVDSPWGHDSFLLDVPDYHRELERFLRHPRPRSGR